MIQKVEYVVKDKDRSSREEGLEKCWQLARDSDKP